MKEVIDNALTLKIVGIIRPNEESSIETSGGVGYTSDLTKYVIDNILKTDKVTGHLEYQLRISDSEIDNTPAYNSNSVLTKEIENTDRLKLYLTWVEDWFDE